MSKNVGLGTAIRRVTKAVGLPHCRACARRQQAMDRLVPRIWPPPDLRRWLLARKRKEAEREARAKRASRGLS